jgi:hypothetical protein
VGLTKFQKITKLEGVKDFLQSKFLNQRGWLALRDQMMVKVFKKKWQYNLLF